MAEEPAELPDDVLADVLRRLAPRWLATSRRVCKAWRAVVDDRGLLRPDLLQRSVRGLFINYAGGMGARFSEFFSRPSTGPAIRGALDFLPGGEGAKVKDHCNGLLLCRQFVDSEVYYYVVNPATERWARLPPRPPPHEWWGSPYTCWKSYLAFDPAVSPDYQVLLVPLTPDCKSDGGATAFRWPPMAYALHVFSSATGRWEERTFVPEEGAGARRIDMTSNSKVERRGGMHWRGALYVRCEHHFFSSGHVQHDFVMRMSLSTNKYRVIGPPPGGASGFQIRRSVKGVCCPIRSGRSRFQISLLDESSSQSKWTLEHEDQVDLDTFARKLLARRENEETAGPWMLQDVNYYYEHRDGNLQVHAPPQGKYEWSFEDDGGLDMQDWVQGKYSGYISILGFHPYKEIVFLDVALTRGVAYHWTTSKFQDLGDICPKDYLDNAVYCADIDTCFPYTPCIAGRKISLKMGVCKVNLKIATCSLKAVETKGTDSIYTHVQVGLF